MIFVASSVPNYGIFINNNYVSLADSATSVTIALEVGWRFATLPSFIVYTLEAGTSERGERITYPHASFGNFSGDITLSASGFPDQTMTTEILAPTFDVTSIPCTKSYTITDTMSNSNPILVGKGFIKYYIQVEDKWILLGTVAKGGHFVADLSFYGPGIYNIKAIYTVSYPDADDCGCGGPTDVPIRFQSEFDSTIEVVNYKPTLSLSSSVDSSIELNDCCKGVIGALCTITPAFNTNVIDTGACPTSTLTYKLFDYLGALLDTVVISIDNASLPSPSTITYTFTPTENKDYTVKAILENCCTSCTTDLIIGACEYIQITNNCNAVTVGNSSLTKTPTITVYDKTNLVIVINPQVMSVGEELVLTLPSDGVYLIRVAFEGDITKNFVVVNYCNIRNCYATALKNVMCADACDPCKEDLNRDTLNKLIALGQNYFMNLQNEFGFNNIYTSLDDTKLKELYDLSEVMSKITKYCKLLGICGTNDTSPGKRGCGC